MESLATSKKTGSSSESSGSSSDSEAEGTGNMFFKFTTKTPRLHFHPKLVHGGRRLHRAPDIPLPGNAFSSWGMLRGSWARRDI